MRYSFLVSFGLMLLLGILGIAHPKSAQSKEEGFQTPLSTQILDRVAFTAWVDGKESRIGQPSTHTDQIKGPEHVIWTRNSAVEWNGVSFGDTKSQGTRYLRIGFTEAVPVGTLLVRGGGTVSVLRPGASYPGRLNNDADWIPAQRIYLSNQSQLNQTISNRNSPNKSRVPIALKPGAKIENPSPGSNIGTGYRVGTGEVGNEEYATWLLPPGTRTRALRFAHTPSPTDRTYAGWLGGVYLLADRAANIAPQGMVIARSNSENASRINDSDSNRTWQAWENIGRDSNGPTVRTAPVSSTAPEDITLIWPRSVNLQGLCALWAGFDAATVYTYVGALDPRTATRDESLWQEVRTYTAIQAQYPRALGVNWLDFGKTISTRAIRLRITQPTRENHDHLRGNTRDGRRVWLGELMAFQPLASQPLSTALLPRFGASTAEALANIRPPIPLVVNLPAPGYVTLVIEDMQGRRIRNLISATYFPKAGLQTVWWDGMDDLGRDTEAARHGVYSVPGQFVLPGTYRVRGLVRPQIDLRYEFSLYNAGHPAWDTADHTGGWLTNHTPPGCLLFVPGNEAPGGEPLVFIGSHVAEGGDGLAWVDLSGRKQGGRGWVGGTWTGAQYLARDAGAERLPEIYAYVASVWEADRNREQGEVRLTGLTSKGDRAILKYPFSPGWKVDTKQAREKQWGGELGGIAVHNGLLVFSLTGRNLLVMVDVRTGKPQGEISLKSPRGLTFASDGSLLVLSDNCLTRITTEQLKSSRTEIAPQLLIATGLEEPTGITLDRQGNIYISDRGESHQVKVFSPDGKLVRSIGHPGTPKAGRYDREHMNNPKGLTIDERDQLWVAEEDFQPKRVSVWSLSGTLIRDFYGPAQYGGGGTLDPVDRSRFYYNGMEFQLDWKAGTDRPVNIFYRPNAGDLAAPDGHGANGMPETPIYFHGVRYMTNAYNSNPTNGAPVAMLWKMENGLARPVAALGRANDWSLLRNEAFRGRWPQGVDPKGDYWQNQALFLWSDQNGDGQVQPEEVTMQRAQVGGITLMPDLSFLVSRVDDRALRFAPTRIAPSKVPIYDLERGQTLVVGAQGPVSSGGDQALLLSDGWTVLTNAPKPFSAYGVGGARNGKVLWTYPSLWPGLHASHESAIPDRPGELVGTTRLLGNAVTPRRGEAGPLWAINGNMGDIYLLTSDGLFVAQLFQDVRQGQPWSMPVGVRGMKLNDLTLHDENFWPSITQTLQDGAIYLLDGARTSLVRVEGLEAIQRIAPVSLTVSAADLNRARAYMLASEAIRQKEVGPRSMPVPILPASAEKPGREIALSGDWQGVEWVNIDKRGVAAWFNSDSKPYDVKAAMRIVGNYLEVAYQTGDKNLLKNSGEAPEALFKTGGALDLMLGTDAGADGKRQRAVAGDIRLLVTRVKDQPRALLYRAVVPGTNSPISFRSPSRGITIDRVEDVTRWVSLFEDGSGFYQISVPLKVLGWAPQAGRIFRGDVGILRGNGFQTLQRVYWSNKATGITADVPSEAELTPQLWGDLRIIPGK